MQPTIHGIKSHRFLAGVGFGVRCATLMLASLAVGAEALQAQGSVAGDRAALVEIYNATGGANWRATTNWLSEEALSEWHGVTTDENGRVSVLNLSWNRLSGTIPAELGDLTELRDLRLGAEDSSGTIPGNPPFLRNESREVFGNDLSGAIPDAMQRLVNLQTLVLSRNSALAGVLPDWLRNLSSLSDLNAHHTGLCAPRDAAFQGWLTTIQFGGLTCPPGTDSVIDVAVFYTPAAKEDRGGTDRIKAAIDLMVAETNQAYLDSGVDQRVSLVAAREVDYEETDSGHRDLSNLEGQGDGHMDGIHAVRDDVGADIVVLLGIFRSGCGRAAQTGTGSDGRVRPFVIMKPKCGAPTFAHELGHVMGLTHERFAVQDHTHITGKKTTYIRFSGEFRNSYGYVNQRAFEEGAPESANWRTIMSYGSRCSSPYWKPSPPYGCSQLMRFSNPYQTHNGDPIGVPGIQKSFDYGGPSDAVGTLNRMRELIAQIRTHPDQAGLPEVSVSVDPAEVTMAEGESVTVTVRLSGDPGRPVAISLTATHQGGARSRDYSGVPATLLFISGETEFAFEIRAEDDQEADPGESLVLGISGDLPDGVTLATPSTVTITIQDNDPLPVAPEVTGTTSFTVTEGEKAVGTLVASDADTPAGDLEWSIAGGADSAHFALSTGGTLAFLASKDYEAPDDAGSDGTYNLSVQVSDGTASATADLSVTLANRNEAPTAHAGPDQTGIQGGAAVTLSGSGDDPDEGHTQDLSYAWTQTGGTTVTLSAPSAATTTFPAPSGLEQDAVLRFALRVTDRDGLFDEDEVQVTVLAAAAPEVTGTTSFTVTEGETAVGKLAASDPDTPAGDLEWSISGGADSAHFALSAGGTLAFLAAKDYEDPDDAGSDGTYNLSVQVSDGTDKATADLSVTLANRNEAPSADAGEDREQVTEDASVTLLGRGTDPDADDTLRYQWKQTGGPPVRLSSPSGDVTTFVAPSGLSEATLLRFTLRVTDSGGLFDEDEVRVRVVPPAAPEVTGTTSFTVTEGETEVGTLTASDADSPADSLHWSITGGADRAHFRLGPDGMLAFLAAKDYESPDDAGSDGSYDLTVQVSDGTDSATADLSVKLANRNEAPVAEAGPDQTRVVEGATVTLSGTGEDPDRDETLNYAWEQAGGPAVKLSAPWSAVTTFEAPSGLAADAELRFRFRVTDGAGLFDGDEVRVTVVAAAPPEVTGTTSFRVTEGETAVGALRASDPDTSESDLEWSIAGGTDSAHFALSAGGELAFLEAKDHEAPDDAGSDGTYDLTVQVSDGTSSAAADLSVTLANRNEAPSADAGPDQTGIDGGATVSLSGGGTDPDKGQTEGLSYAWTQTGGTSVTLSAPAAAATTFTAPSGLEQDTVMTFTLRVTDVEGLFDEDEVQVTVLAAAAPEVTGTTSFTVTEGETAVGTLAASDADTPIGDLRWSIAGGTDSTHFELSAGGTLAFLTAKDFEAPDDAGGDSTYHLTVQVSDGAGSATADVSVKLANRNEAPTADAGADQGDVAGGTTVRLSGSGEDPDAGDSLSYAWTQTGGASVTLSAPAAAATTFVAPSGLEQDAVLRFTLRLTDRKGLFDEDEVQVRVLAAAAPEVTGTTSFKVTEGETAVGTLAASDADTPASDLRWSVTGGTDRAHFELSAAGTLTFLRPKDYEAPDDAGTDGTYNLTVQVSDGTSRTTADINVALANRNEAPMAAAGPDQTGIEGGARVTLTGAGEDPDTGESLSYSWTQAGGTSVSLSAPSAATTTFRAPSGLGEDAVLTFNLRVTDGGGLFDEDEVRVTVVAAAAPEVTGTTSFTVTEGETAVGTLAASDADAAAGDLRWSLAGGADSAHFALSSGGSLAFRAPKDYEAPDDAGSDGTYDLAVQVSDGTRSATADISVALENRNETPTADAGPDQGDIAEGATVTLSGSGEDPDAGDTLSYSWTQTSGPAVTLSAASAAATTFVAPSGLEQDAVLGFQLRVTDGGGLSAEDAVTVTVKPPPLLKGSFASLPATHRGQGTVVLRIQFSEPVATKFRTMRDQSLTVTNGQVQSARRVGGRRDLWEIVIAPSSIADVEVVLPATVDCAAVGAVCTAEGKPLATRLAATIRGPDESELAVISIAAVADTVTEGEPALFEVSRTGPATEELTVQLSWTTSTRSRVSSTTTRFPPGRNSVTVSWSVSGDSIVSDDRIITWTVEEGSGYLVSADASSAQVVMKEVDVAEFALTVDPAEIGESESATVQVAISNDVTFADEQAITLGFGGSTAAKGADYTVSSETLTLRGGMKSVQATVTALVDSDEEGDETVAITASRAGETIGTTAVVIRGTEDSKDGESEPVGEGFSLAPKNSRPSGIWSDGETAWVADLDDARLYAYRRSDGERDSAKDVATGPAPMGLWSDGETLWVAHLGGGLRAHRLADGTRQAWRDLTLEANAAPAGIWADGETAWVSEWLGDTVHAYQLEDGRREASRDIRLAGGNLLPVGLWSDGETLWVADWRERVYAYRLSNGRRDPGKDIHAGVGDTDPSGLWSGGGTLLSTSWDAAEVRAHRLPEVPARGAAPGKGGAGGPPARAASLPPIADPALRAAIGAALGKPPGEAVSPEELAGLATLVARNGGIRDLAGLERAVGLKQLDLGFNLVSDLRPLAALPRLESLNLDGAAPDLQVLASLTGLKRLSVRNNGIEDLGALASLAGLTELDAGDNLIANLRPLSGLGRLEVLRADRNRIADLWPLASLARLEVLELGSNRIGDLQPLAGLARLRKLRLAGNGLAELHPLSSLEGLRDLGLAGNAVEQLRALSHLGGLRRLDLRGNPLGELRSLQALRSLAWVHVGGTRIEDLAPLNGLPGLTVAGRDDLQPPEAGGGAGRAGRD